MKNLPFLLLLLWVLPGKAQHYERSKKNLGIFAAYNFIDDTRAPKSNVRVAPGSALTFGLCHELKQVLYPGIFYSQYKSYYPLPGLDETMTQSYTIHEAGAELVLKLDLFSIDNRKKKGYCFGRMINLNLGLDYIYPIQTTLELPQYRLNPEAGMKGGLGMYSVWGGSAKSHMAWTIHWETWYRRGYTPFLNAASFNPDGSDQPFKRGSFGVTLRVMYHKTYKFSDM
jgi:hypothetical protein